jgi:signal transduction histidine kinase
MAAADEHPDAAIDQDWRGRELLMTYARKRSTAPPWIACAVLAATLLGEGISVAAQKDVLVIYSTRRDAQIVLVGERELPRILDQGLTEGNDYYSEYIDQARFPDPQYQAGFRDFLRLKYRDHRFNVVIAINDLALQFVALNRSELFPDTPIVFFASDPLTRRAANSTGVIAQLNLRGSLELAMTLQPDVQHVYVVSGADRADRIYEQRAREQFAKFEPHLQFTYLTGRRTRELESQLSSLPPRSIVYYVLVNSDEAGEHFHPLEYLDRIAAIANAPIYSWVDSAMSHGIVGGSLKSQQDEMRAVGQLALRVLRGEPVGNIPMSSADLNQVEVDWRQLRRWGIDEGRVPSGAVVRFREPTVWDRYKLYVIAAAALMLAQAMLIAGMLVQRLRRWQAEAAARDSQAELRRSYDRIRDLGGRLLEAQDNERARIARELHDDISQQMALLMMDLEVLGASGSLEESSVREVVARAEGVAKSVHDLSHRLHPAKLRLIGLPAALHALERELAQPGLAISIAHDGVPPDLAPELTVCVFRVAQEAVQNAMKYSKARTITVRLQGDARGLVLNVLDDGLGFDVAGAWGKGLGLISMQERLEAVGGTFEIRSSPGEGTRVTVNVPFSGLQAPQVSAV